MHKRYCSWSRNTTIIAYFFPVMPLVDITVEQIFGDGLVWSGVVMMALLGQQKRSPLPFQNTNSCHDDKIYIRFECFDFCYHIFRVQRIDGMDENFKGIQLKPMVDRIKRFQALNNQVGQLSNSSRVLNFCQKYFNTLEQIYIASIFRSSLR